MKKKNSKRKPALVLALCGATLLLVFSSAVAQGTLTKQRANGKIAFVSRRDGNLEIYVMNPDGSDQTNITHNSALDGGPAWSPDGRKIAFSSNRDGNSEIYVMNADGSGVTRLTYDLAGNYEPDWSPDGTKIAFVSHRDGNSEIYVMNPDGSNQVRLTNDPNDDFYPDWSPDGTRIAFVIAVRIAQIYVQYEIYMMNADGSGQTNITKNSFDNFFPDWSPDGTKIIFDSYADPFCETYGPCGISVMNPDGSNQVSLGVIHGDYPVWSPDGTKIAYVDNTGPVAAVNVMNADGSNRTRLTEDAQGLAWQPLLATSPNPLDDAQFFVRQNYLDFLNRQPDAGGLAFWTNEITLCGSELQCIEAKRINVSAAFFLSIEFQQTGYLVYRFYKASYGNPNGAPVPITLSEFLPDTQKIGQGVIVNQAGWDTILENNKQAFANEFVQRSRFVSAYPTSMPGEQFVDALFFNAGVTPSATDRAAAINEFAFGATTADVAARARALRLVAENSTLAEQEFNRAFVLMQYFGYLRRNPNDAPDGNFDGYSFWLSKLNQFNGNYIQAEMVEAFLISSEYRQRFGP